ncbi:MAG: trehalose-phosphatase [Chloroflexi bacterium]|nr:trehalose-phosphatase [Chloroflexota bacterium]
MQLKTSVQHWKETTDTKLYPLLKAKRLGLIVDMDGTISHIAETPEAAVVTPKSRELLGTLVLMLPMVAAISGRAARDLNQRVAIPGMVYVGNHGLERWEDGGRVLNEDVRRYRKALAASLEDLEPYLTVGMWIEDKYATASVHYRMTPNPEKAANTLGPLINNIAEKHGLKSSPGQKLFEIRPPIEANKGTAVDALVKEFELDAIVYIGDDVTDIDAINAVKALREAQECYGIGIGVVSEENENSQKVADVSDAIAHGVHDVEALLSWLSKAVCQERC